MALIAGLSYPLNTPQQGCSFFHLFLQRLKSLFEGCFEVSFLSH